MVSYYLLVHYYYHYYYYENGAGVYMCVVMAKLGPGDTFWCGRNYKGLILLRLNFNVNVTV